MQLSIHFVLLSCLVICSMSFCDLNHDYTSQFRSMVHHARVNHRFRLDHYEAKYTPQQKKFMDDFGGKLMTFFFTDPELSAAMFSGQNLTDAQNQRIFEFMYNDKDFPKFVALSMRNDSDNSWLAKAPYNQQLKFANIVIDQMKQSKQMNMTDQQMRKIMLKMLDDKDLAKYFINNGKDFDMKKLTSKAQLSKLQSKYPALKKIDPKKITDNDKILIAKTLISDDTFWNKMVATKKLN